MRGCSKEKGVDDPTGFALADLLLGLGAAQEIERGRRQRRSARSAASARRISRRPAGWAAPMLRDFCAKASHSLLKAMHKGTDHVGKVPRAFSARI